ncbi:MAG TPA: hypothetical protein PKY50_17340 [Candidatus Competibacter sp.]|nr:hypothetical protein [Candidatus Competibacter sp.]
MDGGFRVVAVVSVSQGAGFDILHRQAFVKKMIDCSNSWRRFSRYRRPG